MQHREPLIALSIILSLAWASKALALDTTEPFDTGFSDFELYFGAGGLGLGAGERTLATEACIGVGLTETLSGTLFYGVESDEYLSSDEDELSAGLKDPEVIKRAATSVVTPIFTMLEGEFAGTSTATKGTGTASRRKARRTAKRTTRKSQERTCTSWAWT